jgi:deoxyribodipyrimidine photo-lyase
MKKYPYGIFIFTRDLRLEDNSTLNIALQECEEILPIFIFNPKQISAINSYRSDNSIQFMMESLDEVNSELNKYHSRLFYFYGLPIDIIKKLISIEKPNKIYINKDYTPFAQLREKSLQKICKEKSIEFSSEEDYMLTGVTSVKKPDDTFYVKFTPYHRTAKKIPVKKPTYLTTKDKTCFVKKTHKISFEYKKDIHHFYKPNPNIIVRGGRKNGLKILSSIKKFSSYNVDREVPSLHGTTYLSAYLKYNVISIREVYLAFKTKLSNSNKLLTQLFWRDFYMQIMYHHTVIHSAMKISYNDIQWENNPTWIKKWKNGLTGIPIVDAGMRQLNKIGWMHNRVRMIVANFLVKILRCDWMIGEKYFAQKLVDYDPANNNGGWQWSASSGTDSQPYFRVFNPWRQAENYDHECSYIKEWIPELKDVPNKDILNWDTQYTSYKNISYPKPIVMSIQEEFKKTLKLYKK